MNKCQLCGERFCRPNARFCTKCQQLRRKDERGLFRCPFCGSDRFGVVDTRKSDNTIRRRRQCKECGHKSWTTEMLGDRGLLPVAFAAGPEEGGA